MEQKYELREVGGAFILAGCPAVYEVRNDCLAGACPSVHASEANKDKYYVVGRQLTQQEIKDLGLIEKVAEGEAVMEVPKGLLKNLKID